VRESPIAYAASSPNDFAPSNGAPLNGRTPAMARDASVAYAVAEALPINDAWEDPSADLEDDDEPPWEPPIAVMRKPSNPQGGGKVATKPPPLTTSLYPTRPKSNGGNGHNGGNGVSKDKPNHASKNALGDNGIHQNTAQQPSNGDATYTPPPPPDDPPGPPSTLYITLRRSGDTGGDFAKLSRLHRMLRSQVGSDHFVVVLEGGGQSSVELSFPNESTCYTPSLRERVEGIVGKDNLRVVMTA
jgi:hypothetical protein